MGPITAGSERASYFDALPLDEEEVPDEIP